MSGTLYVVATPIGNLEDITLRALRILRESDLVAAEDTRRTARLLAHHGISTPRISFHEHNTRSRLPLLLERLQKGHSVALVTDAGTPGVSDPGIALVRACITAGIAVDPLPGPSAPLTAAVASGFPLNPLTVHGFSPDRSKDRITWFSNLAGTTHTQTFFEAPHRIQRTLGAMAKYLGERQIVVAREMTKLHQEFLRGTCAEVEERLVAPRGEFTVVIGPLVALSAAAVQEVSGTAPEEIAREFWVMTEKGAASRRAAIREVAARHGLAPGTVYELIERLKKSVE